jgi:hypothetical protein
MRTKNSRPHDEDEAAWLADVKRVPCVFCNARPPVEGHHPKQGLHFLAIAACDTCHDARVWRIGGITEQEASNETVRRVIRYRAGLQIHSAPRRSAKPSPCARPDKIIPRTA